VHAGSVPVTLDNGLGVEGAVDLELLADTLEDVPGHEELVAGVDSDAEMGKLVKRDDSGEVKPSCSDSPRSNLVLLLSGHDLSVGSRDLNAGVQAAPVHGIGHSAAERVLGSGRAVVRSLGPVGDTALGPAERSDLIEVEEGELLLESEPDLLVILSIESGGGCYLE